MDILVRTHIMDDYADEINTSLISLDEKEIEHIFELSNKTDGDNRISEYNYTPIYGNIEDPETFFKDRPYVSVTKDELKVFQENEDFYADCALLHVDKKDFWWTGLIKHTQISWENRMIPLEILGTGRDLKTNSLDAVFEALNRLEHCSPKSEPWIKENAIFIREQIQKIT